MRKQHESGFSLIEVMTVIAIVAILAGIVTPNFFSWRAKNQLRGAINNLKCDMELAKARAINKAVPVAVVFGADRYDIFTDASGAPFVRDGSDVRLISRELPSGISVELATTSFGANDWVSFDSRGISSDTGVVELVNPKGEGQISVNAIGLVTIDFVHFN